MVIVVVVLLAGQAAPSPGTASAAAGCAHVEPSRVMSDDGIHRTQALGLASGRYALPADPEPSQLVVLMHGYGNDSCSWRNHLRTVAGRGAIAIAMDYTEQETVPGGWHVTAGAAHSIQAARWFMDAYPSVGDVFVMGVSMGGNASGMAVASADAVRADGSPLFDAWVAVEGVHNLVQEYAAYGELAPQFGQDVEDEAGGTPASAPDAYAGLTNIARAADMADLPAAVLIHGAEDATVHYNQSRDMAVALRAVGVPVELYTVLGRGDGEAGSTYSGFAAGAFEAAGLAYESPFAGHAWEGSDSHIVMRLAFQQLFSLMDGKHVGPYRELLVHGEGLIV